MSMLPYGKIVNPILVNLYLLETQIDEFQKAGKLNAEKCEELEDQLSKAKAHYQQVCQLSPLSENKASLEFVRARLDKISLLLQKHVRTFTVQPSQNNEHVDTALKTIAELFEAKE